VDVVAELDVVRLHDCVSARQVLLQSELKHAPRRKL
jgi:hypothetical protein